MDNYTKTIGLTQYHYDLLTEFANKTSYTRETLLEVILDRYHENNLDALADASDDEYEGKGLA